jgi:tetratricopeptide (TPR) repeat protein
VEQAAAFTVAPPPGPESFDEKPPKIAGTPLADDIEKRAAAASPQMKPQWLYARGAIGYCAGDRYECAKWFEHVWKEYPDHPRAEAALFLSARCAFRASRDNPWNGPSPNAPPPTDQVKAAEKIKQQTFDNAVALFRQYLKTYPHGRFVADAYGWLGALDLRVGNNAAALDDYIHQVEIPGHPEVIKSALFMCQDVLSGAKSGDNALFALAARHPLVAMGATYFALQTPSGGGLDDTADQTSAVYTQGEEYRDDTARAKKWRQEVLPKLAAQVVAQKALYRADAWPSRYLAMLAQAASAVGRQDQALALTEISAAQLDVSDDLLLARGIAFQRANRPAEAVTSGAPSMSRVF